MNKNNKNKRKIVIVTLAAIASGITSIAKADLYISPILRESVAVDEKLNNELSNKKDGKVLVGNSDKHGRFVMQEKSEAAKKPFASGSNVPLFFAMEANIPENEDWIVHIEENIQNKPISWEDNSGNWEGTLKTIAKQNNLHITINPTEKAIGVSSDSEISYHMAKRVPQIWSLKSGKSLKKNLTDWSNKAGWSLQWDKSLEVDYMVNHNALFTGSFIGEGGVVSQVLNSMSNSSVPLRAEFYKKNKVLLIKESGFSQEVNY